MSRHPGLELRRSPTLDLAERVAQRARGGNQAVSLSNPSLPATPVRFEPTAAWTKLTPAAGLPELREASKPLFAPWTAPDHTLIIAGGAKAALFCVLRAACPPGTQVVVPTPAWPSYADLVTTAALSRASLPCHATNAFALDLEAMATMAAMPDTSAILLSSPCNPTGRILRCHEVEALVRMAHDHACLLIVDQSFSQIVFDDELWQASAGEAHERVALIDSFSKSYLLQGARVAPAFLPNWLADRAIAVHQTIFSAAPASAQFMALAALDAGARMPRLDPQRAVALELVQGLGWITPPSEGTFYLYPKVPNLEAWRARAEAAGLFALSGDAFAGHDVDHIRFAFARPLDELAAIADTLVGLKGRPR